LAKACRRHAVPVPPRGYWAKLKAGQRPVQIPLPTPELDVPVQFATQDPEELARHRREEEQRRKSLQDLAPLVPDLPPLGFASDLAGAPPLVKATQRYCDTIPRLIERWERSRFDARSSSKREEWPPIAQHGRYSLIRRGCLDITASLASMDWILRFHATVLGGLARGGMTILRKETPPEPGAGMPAECAIEARFKGEVLALRFSEGYKRIRPTPQEFAARKKEKSWTDEYEVRPSGNFTFALKGTEHAAGREWKGTAEKLQGQVDEIVRTIFQMACLQPQFRSERKTREEAARIAAELEARRRSQRQARSEQLKQAFLMMDEDARVRQLQDFLQRLEARAQSLRKPLNERVTTWIGVVREELCLRDPVSERLEQCLTVPSWGRWPPAWWPDGLSLGEEE
jgi:hypothetical protein